MIDKNEIKKTPENQMYAQTCNEKSVRFDIFRLFNQILVRFVPIA